MAASASVDIAGGITVSSLQNTGNINASGASTQMLDMAPYMGTLFVVLNNGNGATNTALACKLFTSSDSNALNYNNYTTAANFATISNIGTAVGTSVTNVDLRAISGTNNRYLGLSYVISGTGANVCIDAVVVGQKKVSS